MIDYSKMNEIVMCDTKNLYEMIPELQRSISISIKNQYMVAHEETLERTMGSNKKTEFVVSGKRTLQAAKYYVGKKVAVLNFANNHSIGGAPFHAGAQEESMCRCSTLYPCLQAMDKVFYSKHRHQFEIKEIGYMGNDDLIYTPGVMVFKTDELAEIIYPKLMPQHDWYKVDVITCAAPELMKMNKRPSNYENQMVSRIKKILDVAEREQVEVLILGAWGCGAFKNPIDVVARIFYELLKDYHFEVVEFALSQKDVSNTPFAKYFTSYKDELKEEFIALLESTGRENTGKVVKWLTENGFFEAPASVKQHNNFKGGLVKHSLDVYREACVLNEEKGLPQSSIILCSLLHDVCKANQYYIDLTGKPARNEEMCKNGHGRRSMYILKRGCQLPLNYDEEMAIWWHMGEHEESKKRYPREYMDSIMIALCSLIQKADGIAANKSKRCNL